MKTKLKRTLIILFSAVCCFCMLFPIASYSSVRLSAHADYLSEEEEDLVFNRLKKIYNYLIFGQEPEQSTDPNDPTVNPKLREMDEMSGKIDDVQKAVEQVKIQTDVDVSEKQAADDILKIPQFIASITNGLWNGIIAAICEQDPATSTYAGTNENVKLTINPLDPNFSGFVDVFKIAAYSLVLVFFSVSLIEQSVKYEIFTMKGALHIFGRLLVSKVIIDLSTTICGKILGTIGYIIKRILGGDSITSFSSFMPDVDLKPCGIKLVGNIVDTIISVVLASAILLIVGTVFVFTAIVMIKLLLRAFELTMLVCTSPVFFACASSDVTKEYFKKFIVTFLEVACQTLFMCIALKIGMEVLTGHLAGETINSIRGLSEYFENQLPYVIVLVAMCVMMIKPPKVLTNLLKG